MAEPTAPISCMLCTDAIEGKAYHVNKEVEPTYLVCKDCASEEILDKITEAVTTETEWPAAWGDTLIAPEEFSEFFSEELKDALAKKEREYEFLPRERVYCPKRLASGQLCSAYVGKKQLQRMHCEACKADICMHCAVVWTDGHECVDDLEESAGPTGALEGLQRGKDFQLCPNDKCQTIVELKDGCNAMRCPMANCTTQFCFVCGRQADHDGDHWTAGQSTCPRFNQPDAANPMFDPAVEPRRLFAGRVEESDQVWQQRRWQIWHILDWINIIADRADDPEFQERLRLESLFLEALLGQLRLPASSDPRLGPADYDTHLANIDAWQVSVRNYWGFVQPQYMRTRQRLDSIFEDYQRDIRFALTAFRTAAGQPAPEFEHPLEPRRTLEWDVDESAEFEMTRAQEFEDSLTSGTFPDTCARKVFARIKDFWSVPAFPEEFERRYGDDHDNISEADWFNEALVAYDYVRAVSTRSAAGIFASNPQAAEVLQKYMQTAPRFFLAYRRSLAYGGFYTEVDIPTPDENTADELHDFKAILEAQLNDRFLPQILPQMTAVVNATTAMCQNLHIERELDDLPGLKKKYLKGVEWDAARITEQGRIFTQFSNNHTGIVETFTSMPPEALGPNPIAKYMKWADAALQVVGTRALSLVEQAEAVQAALQAHRDAIQAELRRRQLRAAMEDAGDQVYQ